MLPTVGKLAPLYSANTLELSSLESSISCSRGSIAQVEGRLWQEELASQQQASSYVQCEHTRPDIY